MYQTVIKYKKKRLETQLYVVQSYNSLYFLFHFITFSNVFVLTIEKYKSKIMMNLFENKFYKSLMIIIYNDHLFPFSCPSRTLTFYCYSK